MIKYLLIVFIVAVISSVVTLLVYIPLRKIQRWRMQKEYDDLIG